MKIVVAQDNTKFMTWAPVKLSFFYHVYCMNFNKQFAEKVSFHHVVLNN